MLFSPYNGSTELGEMLISFTESNIFLFIPALSSRSFYYKGLIKFGGSFDGPKKRYDEKTEDFSRLIRWLLRSNELSDDVKSYINFIRLFSDSRVEL
jgi:hypothetical protein